VCSPTQEKKGVSEPLTSIRFLFLCQNNPGPKAGHASLTLSFGSLSMDPPKVPSSVHTPSVSGTAAAFDEVTLKSTGKVYTQ
jgi:hypothetical protein